MSRALPRNFHGGEAGEKAGGRDRREGGGGEGGGVRSEESLSCHVMGERGAHRGRGATLHSGCPAPPARPELPPPASAPLSPGAGRRGWEAGATGIPRPSEMLPAAAPGKRGYLPEEAAAPARSHPLRLREASDRSAQEPAARPAAASGSLAPAVRRAPEATFPGGDGVQVAPAFRRRASPARPPSSLCPSRARFLRLLPPMPVAAPAPKHGGGSGGEGEQRRTRRRR